MPRRPAPRLFVCLYSAADAALARNLLASLDRCGCGGDRVRAYCTDTVCRSSNDDDRHHFLDVSGVLARVPVAARGCATALLRYLVILAELRAGNDVWFLDVGTVVRVDLDALLWRHLQAAQMRCAAPVAVFGDECGGGGSGVVSMLFSSEAESTLVAFLAERCCRAADAGVDDNAADVVAFFQKHTPMYLPLPQRLDVRRFPRGTLFFGPRGKRRSDQVRAEAWIVRTDHLDTVDAKIRALRASGQWLCYRS